MNAQRLKEIEEIFLAAVEIKPAERESFFNEKCGADEELRREVESLLSFEDTGQSFLDASPEALAAEMFTERGKESNLIDQQIGHYKIKRLLGKGGMGEVYLAEDAKLNRRVALKFLPIKIWDDKNVLRRFKQEALAASALNHPNILTIYEFQADDDLCYLATEYIEGETLREKVRRENLTLGEALNIAEQIALALSAAHKANIIHRDIKPENIMLREDGIVKILDFGLAKLTGNKNTSENFETRIGDAGLTKTGTIMGTTSYMSPEQVRGRGNLDARTDTWSLGVVLFEMLAGEVPFAGDTVGDTIAAILKTDTPLLSTYVEDCPPEIERVVKKALAKNIDERYREMRDFAAEIKKLRNRLEFEAELERSKSPGEIQQTKPKLQTAVQNNQTRVSPELSTQIIPASISFKDFRTAQNSQEFAHGKNRSRWMTAMLVLVLLGGSTGGFFIWKSNYFAATAQLAAASISPTDSNLSVVRPLRQLKYSLVVQAYNDGRYKDPFQLSSEMLFRNKDRLRLNIKTSQDGYLYVLNESPKDGKGETSFNILFPSPLTHYGDPLLRSNQQIQIPQKSWFEFDDKEGTEVVWLIWSENPLPELDAAMNFNNEKDKGKISDPVIINFINTLLQKNQLNKTQIEKDDDKKISQMSSNADILLHAVKLEHH